MFLQILNYQHAYTFTVSLLYLLTIYILNIIHTDSIEAHIIESKNAE